MSLLHLILALNCKQETFRNYIDENDPTPISDDTYDVAICCAGFFQGLISPNAFIELIRITKPGESEGEKYVKVWFKCTKNILPRPLK